MKHDSEKSRVDLIPAKSLLEVGKVLGYGSKKYGENNWQSLDNGIKRYKAAALRHLLQADFEDKDSETGLSHYTHACANLLFIIHLLEQGND